MTTEEENKFLEDVRKAGKALDQTLFFALCSMPKPRKKNLNHRMLLFLLAKYDSATDVAEFIGISKRHVNSFKRQNLEKIKELRKLI